MSRNSEKAQSALNRFQAMKNKEAGVLESNPSLRPKYVQSVESLAQAEKWRATVVREISVQQTKINDPTLNEYQVRDVNDALNKLLKEKRSWEYHIRDLGGPDYTSMGINFDRAGQFVNVEEDGARLRGYRYFGRAKELPEFRNAVLAKEKVRGNKRAKFSKEQKQKLKLEEREKRLGAFYYGFEDEQGCNGVEDDQEIEQELMAQIQETLGASILQEETVYNENYQESSKSHDDLLSFERNMNTHLLKEMKKKQGNGKAKNLDHIVDFENEVPSTDQVLRWLVDKRKKELLNRLNIQS